MRYVIYIMIGVGIAAGINVRGNDLTFIERSVVTVMWPAVVSGAVVVLVAKDNGAKP